MPTAVANYGSDNLIVSSFSYTYRGDGNIATETDHNNVTTTYTYDLLGRLVSEVGGYSRYYSYDAAGNRTQAIVDTSTTISYTYDSDGRLISETSNDGSSLLTTSYVYDSNGSLISENDGDVTTYAYDVWGNMVSAGGASYAYNAQGLRISKTVSGVTDNFVLVGGDVWKDSENTYLRGLELISSDDYFYLYNIRGDVIQLLNYSGEVVKTYDYDAYGNELNRDLSDENPFRYCGEYYDVETGFVYLRARYYDPSVGRFTSVDPIKDGLNWYNYCDSDPLNRIDSTGEAWYHWAIGAAIVVACAAAVVLTAGGALAAVTAVGMVTSGVAATTTATTVASYAFIGSAFAFGGCVLSAGFSAKTPQEFADEGNWGTVLSTAGGAAAGGAFGYLVDRIARNNYDSANVASNITDDSDVWDMPEGGKTINGTEYSQHALERMAPDTPSVRAELNTRAHTVATANGYQIGTEDYRKFVNNYVQPRNVPPMVVEDAIKNTPAISGKYAGTFDHITNDVRVTVNQLGKVITVWKR